MKRACLKNSNKFLFPVILIIGLVLANFSVYQVNGQTPQTKTDIQQPVKYTCPMHPEVIKEKPGKCPICGMDLVKMQPVAVVKYTCPMHPEVIKEKPGKCPVCGMDLVVKKETKK